LINDAADGLYDVAYLISGDSDLVPALEIAKNRDSARKFRIWFPPERPSGDLIRHPEVDFSMTIPRDFIKKSQFPDEFEHNGVTHSKPEKWR